jgi:hypothetical protein
MGSSVDFAGVKVAELCGVVNRDGATDEGN